MPLVSPSTLFPFFPPAAAPATSARRQGGLSSDNAKDIRHLLKMQNIPSEGEKGRDRPRLSVMLRILIAQISSGFAGTKASDRSRSLDLRFFIFSNCLLRAMSNSIDGSGVLSA